MDHPTPPPEAVLVRLVRQAAHVTIAAAAKRAGISTARWTQIEQGYETRASERKPAWAPADTLAYMAGAIGLPPDRLETEGQRPDAAAVLREMQRHSAPPVPPAAGIPDGDPVVEYVRSLPGLSPGERESLEEVARPRPHLDVTTRRALVGLALAMRDQDQAQNRSA